jgi:hypothetical protein
MIPSTRRPSARVQTIKSPMSSVSIGHPLCVATAAARGIFTEPATIPVVFPPSRCPEMGDAPLKTLAQIPARMRCCVRVGIRQFGVNRPCQRQIRVNSGKEVREVSPALPSVNNQVTRADRGTSSGALPRITGLHGLHVFPFKS